MLRALIRACVMSTALAALLAVLPGTVPAETPPKKPGARKGAAARKEKTANQRGTLPAGTKLDALALARHIDKQIEKRLRADKVTPSPRADDSEFLRRVYLDLTGTVPTAEKAVAFLDSKDPNKRAKLIDELLDSKEYGRHMADVWQALLLPRDSETFRIRQYFPHMVKWLEESFNENKPWDKMAREVLTCSGAVDKTGPVVYYLANPTVDKVTDNFTKVFLGVQLQCAQCHNHPFTDWKQDEYWGMAAFFIKVQPEGNPRAAAKDGKSINISEARATPRGKRRLPESAKILPPKFLGGEQAKVSSNEPNRPALADWVASPKNPFLARALVNRLWHQLLGRGFVSPVDDMHEGNAPSHPELLQDLSSQFVASGFDVKHLIRAICNSETYQRTSKPAGNNADAGPEYFARAAVKVLTPEQLFDSLALALGRPAAQNARAQRPGFQRAPANPREAFIAFFNLEDGADPTEYQAGIPQVLRLMNGPQFNNAPALATVLRTSKDWKEATEKLYLATLSRRPTSEELARVGRHLQKHRVAGENRQAMADVLWALVNSSEFAVNH